MIIQIAGYGFVGKAHALALAGGNRSIRVYDPAKHYNHWNDDADCYIIAVSTPQAKDGSCDMRNVFEIIETIMEKNPNAPILIKSTISLEGWRLVTRAYKKAKLTFSPEYLRADHAMEDFKNQTRVDVGGGDAGFWCGLLSEGLGIPVETKNPESLILTKYFCNSFLATKVAFFQQIHDMCIAANVDANEVLTYVSDDPRIGKSHTYVSSVDKGFGGHCLPKDVSAMISTSMEHGYDLSVLKEVMEYNERLQNEKNSI